MDPERGLEARRRLFWIAAARAVLCLFAAAVIRLNVTPSETVATLLPYAIVATAFAMNAVYMLLRRTRLPWRITAMAETVLDVFFITALVLATGGVSSDFRLLYFGPILAAAVLFARGSALFIASLASIGLFSCVTVYAIGGTVPSYVDQAWRIDRFESASGLVGVLILQAAAFHLVAYLAATLTLRLRTANIETGHILENMSDGVVTVAKDGRVVFANTKLREMLAIPPESTVVGTSLAEIAPGPVCREFLRVVSSGEPSAIEMTVGATPMEAQVRILPLLDPSRKLRGANVIFYDLTERRKLTEALRRAERSEATATTVASIAHEIRNPLAAIRGSAQELQKALEVSGPDARLFDLIVRESDRLDRVLTDFLKFSSMSKTRPATFNLRELLEGVVSQLEVANASLEIDVTISGPVELFIDGDAGQLRQVFVNLGLNALDATGGAGPVVFEIKPLDKGVEILTRDKGGGIADEVADKVFEPFFTTKTTGTGLGLPIARQIVSEHAGVIDLENNGDGWTCVKVFLPQAETHPEAA